MQVTIWRAVEVMCPHCGAQNIPGARLTIEREQDGSLSCRTCAWNWKEVLSGRT